MSCFDGFPLPPRDEDGDEWVDSDELEDDHAEWRGDVHTGDWPEECAGPEWEMYKKLLDDESDAGS